MRIAISLLIIIAVLVGLVSSAVMETSKDVVTVHELLGDLENRQGIRLGARVADREIEYTSEPSFLLQFYVVDIEHPKEQLKVVYRNIMPDTLKAGRDVILEGHFNGKFFFATSLLTQCPSKYEPPSPDGKSSDNYSGSYDG